LTKHRTIGIQDADDLFTTVSSSEDVTAQYSALALNFCIDCGSPKLLAADCQWLDGST